MNFRVETYIHINNLKRYQNITFESVILFLQFISPNLLKIIIELNTIPLKKKIIFKKWDFRQI